MMSLFESVQTLGAAIISFFARRSNVRPKFEIPGTVFKTEICPWVGIIYRVFENREGLRIFRAS